VSSIPSAIAASRSRVPTSAVAVSPPPVVAVVAVPSRSSLARVVAAVSLARFSLDARLRRSSAPREFLRHVHLATKLRGFLVDEPLRDAARVLRGADEKIPQLLRRRVIDRRERGKR
jgi:hypothetical protein